MIMMTTVVVVLMIMVIYHVISNASCFIFVIKIAENESSRPPIRCSHRDSVESKATRPSQQSADSSGRPYKFSKKIIIGTQASHRRLVLGHGQVAHRVRFFAQCFSCSYLGRDKSKVYNIFFFIEWCYLISILQEDGKKCGTTHCSKLHLRLGQSHGWEDFREHYFFMVVGSLVDI